MGKMDKKWVILCSTAVAAVYAAGYYTTETQAANNNNVQPIQQIAKNIQAKNNAINNTKISNGQTNDSAASQVQLNSQQTKDTTAYSSQTNTKSSNSMSEKSNQKSSLYKNGTFTGQGMNRRGMIQVQLTINNDKITNVQISDWGMHYSESDVVGLPDEVLKNQRAQVTNVSGATYSSQAFEDAVQDALNQAHNTVG